MNQHIIQTIIFMTIGIVGYVFFGKKMRSPPLKKFWILYLVSVIVTGVVSNLLASYVLL